jgi:hypothetical protein
MWERCTDLWFTRHQVLDRAGACFDDPAVAQLFGNSDCAATAPELTELDLKRLAMIEAMSDELGCDGNVDGGSLRILRADLRQKLEFVPVPTTEVRGCYLWSGEPVVIFAGPDEASEVIDAAVYGEDIFWEYDTPGAPEGWAFVTVYLDGALSRLGWTNEPVDPASCGAMVE